MLDTIIEGRCSKIINHVEFFKEIAVIFPGYGSLQGGNITRIYLNSGEELEDNRSLEAFLKRLARFYHVDIPALRKTVGELLDCTNSTPLPLCRHLIFVPIKVRKPLFRGDGATGYIALHAIDKVRLAKTGNKEEVECNIHLKSGKVVPSLTSLQNTERRIRQARRVLTYFLYLKFDRVSLEAEVPAEWGRKKKRKFEFKDQLIFRLIDDDEDKGGGSDGSLPDLL